MLIFRFLSVFIISFLLLSPLIKRSEKIIEKPIVIIGIDNSSSITRTADSAFYRHTFPASVDKMVADLGRKADVKIYSFGDHFNSGFKPGFTDKQTDISSFFREVDSRYANRNVAAIVLASDGIYNQGSDPYYASRSVQYPVYTVALGDTNLRKDLIIKRVIANKVAYKGDRFPVEVQIELDKCNGLKTKLILSKGETPGETREIRINTDQSLQQVTFWLDAGQPGISRYKLELSPADGEANLENNHAEFLIEVIEARQQCALVYNAPHPDVMAIRKAVEGSTHFEVTMMRLDELPGSLDKYDLIILDQIPSISSVADLKPIFKSKASLLFVLGSQTDVNAFNGLKTGLVINASKNSFYEAEPVLNKEFSLFLVGKQEQLIVDDFPPLQAPFGTYQLSPLSDVLFYQQIANVPTQTPLVMFARADQRKIGIIAGENIWRWRISNFIKQSNHDIFDMMMDKITMYLATKDDKSFFRIHVKNRFSENEPVEMEAEVFNPSYERITEPDVNLTITDKDNKNYPFLFSKGPSAYYLNAGLFPVGNFMYNAVVKTGKEIYQKSGEFYVSENNLESSALIADHHLLARIAISHDAEMISPRDLDKLFASK